MKKIYLVILLGIITNGLMAQNETFDWAKSMGGNSVELGFSIITDVFGNVYTTGSFQGTADFDPGVGVVNLTSNGAEDIFIQKLDANGNLIWAKSMGSASGYMDQGNSIITDKFGDIYLTGVYANTVDFDPGVGVFNLTSNGYYDIFVLKLAASGNFVWAKSMGGTGFDGGSSIVTDSNANVYTIGYFQTSVDFDPGVGVFSLAPYGAEDIFIQKLDANGNFIWAKSMGGTGGDGGTSIVTDATGNVYTTGVFQNTVDFNPGVGVFNLTSNGSREIFIQKLDTNGNFIWAKSIGGSGAEQGNSVVTDANGNVYSTGYFNGTVDFDPGVGIFNLTSNGARDIFLLKLDTTGNFVWAKAMGGIGSDEGLFIIADANGNVYSTGVFNGTVDFDPGVGVFNLTSNGNDEIFIQKLDTNGNFIWAKSLGGFGYDRGNSICTNGIGNIYVIGSYQNAVDFDPGVGVFNLTSNGSSDVFVLKLSACVTSTGTDTRTECSPFVWIDGNTYTANNTTAKDTIVGGAFNGCDSIVTLNLTITTVDTSVTKAGTNLTANELVATYQWLDCDNNYAVISGETFRTYYVLADGNYAVEVTYYGCVDTSSCYNVIVSSIAENTVNNNITIYPNPVKKQLTITVENEKINNIKIMDVMGKVLQTFEENPTTINVANLSKGLYLLQIQTDKGIGVKRFIKE